MKGIEQEERELAAQQELGAVSTLPTEITCGGSEKSASAAVPEAVPTARGENSSSEKAISPEVPLHHFC